MDQLQAQHLMEQIYTSFNKRDLGLIDKFMHPDVHWPNGWEGGYVEGHDGVRNYWSRQWKEIDPEVIPEQVQVLQDDRVSVIVSQTVKDLDGKLLHDGKIKHIYTIQDGLISKMVIEEM